MRIPLSALAAAVLTLSVVGSAQADVMGWEGTLQLQLGSHRSPFLFTHDSGTFGGGGVVLNGSAGLGHLKAMVIPAQDLAGLGGQAFNLPGSLSPTGVTWRATAFFGGGTFAPISRGTASTGPLTQNTAPVPGIIKVCQHFPACQLFIPIPLTAGGTRGMGLGGLITVSGFAPAGIKVSIQGNPWTVRTAAVTGILTDNGGFTTRTAKGFAHGPKSLTSSAANVGGVVQLVTPVRVETSLATSPVVELFGTLRIRIVPEPGTALLFGSGIAALAVARRRRGSRRGPPPNQGRSPATPR